MSIIGRRRRWRRWEERRKKRFWPHIKWMCDSMHKKRDQSNESGLVYSHVFVSKGRHGALWFSVCWFAFFPWAIILLLSHIDKGVCLWLVECLMICVKAFSKLGKKSSRGYSKFPMCIAPLNQNTLYEICRLTNSKIHEIENPLASLTDHNYLQRHHFKQGYPFL